MKKLCLVMAFVVCSFWVVGGAFAATDTENLTINAAVSARAKLTLSDNTINFIDADPDVTDPIPATENAVTVEVKARTGALSDVTLTHRASGNLIDGAKTITIDNVTWTATGAGYVAGTMSTGSDVAAGSWTGPGDYDGTFSYFLDNDWAYEPGSYSASSTYTLTAP
jgi:hypothetical protein